jgi:hypothetical protein
MDSDTRYLDLMKKAITNTLYIEHPVSLEMFNYIRPLYKQVPIMLVTQFIKRFGLSLCLNRYVNERDRKDGRMLREYADTLIGIKGLDNIQYCIEEVLKNNIEGDLIETGVWRGGACIFMKAMLMAYGSNRKVYVADSFEGLPKPHSKYPADKGSIYYKCKNLIVSQEEVERNFEKYGLLDNNVVFIKGWFSKTLPTLKIDKLSILRIDCDMYGSTTEVLNTLYDKLSIGGFCIVDDYSSLPECKKAVDDYIRQKQLRVTIHEVDWTRIYWRK